MFVCVCRRRRRRQSRWPPDCVRGPAGCARTHTRRRPARMGPAAHQPLSGDGGAHTHTDTHTDADDDDTRSGRDSICRSDLCRPARPSWPPRTPLWHPEGASDARRRSDGRARRRADFIIVTIGLGGAAEDDDDDNKGLLASGRAMARSLGRVCADCGGGRVSRRPP
jgi:hypothetical protein